MVFPTKIHRRREEFYLRQAGIEVDAKLDAGLDARAKSGRSVDISDAVSKLGVSAEWQ
jgi:hypothetical protein